MGNIQNEKVACFFNSYHWLFDDQFWWRENYLSFYSLWGCSRNKEVWGTPLPNLGGACGMNIVLGVPNTVRKWKLWLPTIFTLFLFHDLLEGGIYILVNWPIHKKIGFWAIIFFHDLLEGETFALVNWPIHNNLAFRPLLFLVCYPIQIDFDKRVFFSEHQLVNWQKT